MATREQCKARLKNKSADELDRIIRKLGFEPLPGVGWSDDEYLRQNRGYILKRAADSDKLDELGMALGYPSDEEAKRLSTGWAITRSWLALGVALLALLVSATLPFALRCNASADQPTTPAQQPATSAESED